MVGNRQTQNKKSVRLKKLKTIASPIFFKIISGLLEKKL
jgi:hypothetical protein